MEVITISSDSETSFNAADVSMKNSSPQWWQNEEYNLDWNDDSRSPINYSLESPKNDVPEEFCPKEEIEDFNTPMKSSQGNISMADIEFEDTLPCKGKLRAGSLTSESTSDPFSQSSSNKLNEIKKRKKLSQEEKIKEKMLKEQRKLEKEKVREEKKAEQQKQKALKAAFFENQRNLKPEENIKFFKVHIDNEIINSSFGANVITLLQENNIQYVVEPQPASFTVMWTKKRTEKVIEDIGEVTENVIVEEQNILLHSLHWKKAVELIYNNDLLSHIEAIRSAYSNKNITVVVCGLEKYFNYKNNKRNHEMRAAINNEKNAKPKFREKVFEEAPSITKDQLEFAVTDLQLIGNHNFRLIETSEEFASFIHNITKSLSQIDYKIEKQKRQKNDFGWISSDSHQSVKVDKNGNGLLRLWQQQICQFSSVGLETAQAIVSQYNSPLALMKEYNKIESSKDKELLLQNIQIRREAGILSTSRRVGPQLSKKIHKFFTSDDPDVEL